MLAVDWPNGWPVKGMTWSRPGASRSGDVALLELAKSSGRVLVTIDTDFGSLVMLGGAEHAGLVRLPDVPAAERIKLMQEVLSRHGEQLAQRAVITVRGGRIRVSRGRRP